MDILKQLSQELNLPENQVSSAVQLMDQGNTIPFIARYRKEFTGSLDDQVLRRLQERLEYLRSLEKRREDITSAIQAQEKLTPELEKAISAAATLTELEDIYRPFRPKRKTRASAARERGLEPLAAWIFSQQPGDPTDKAAAFVSEEKGVPSPEAAIDGARDIVAEDISDNAAVRRDLRAFTFRTGVLTVKAADPNASSVYETYYDFSEPVHKAASHRVLAIERGEREGFLKVSVVIEAQAAVTALQKKFVKNNTPAGEIVAEACADSFSRLIYPAIER